MAADPTLDVAERQLVMLRELGQIAIAVSRAFGSSAMAAAEAEKRILADEYFVPEVGRARACGAKDAADSFQKASRAVRLTFKLEMAVAETIRDIRAGIVTYTVQPKGAGETPAVLEPALDRRRPAGSCPDDRETDVTRFDSDTERLFDIERPDTFPGGSFRETVDRISGDLGATVDWAAWNVGSPTLESEPLQPKPPGCRESRPPDCEDRGVEPDPAFSP